MKLFVYTVRDAAAGFYNTPFYARAHGEAERNFERLVRDPQSTVSQHPEDFDLYYLGQYDDQTGKMELLDTPNHIRKAVDHVQRPALQAATI